MRVELKGKLDILSSIATETWT